MTDALARIMFGATVLLLVPVLAYIYLSSQPTSEGHAVVVQFEDAFPLVEGMNVRVDGGIAGSVGRIAVNDEGVAEVTLHLDDAIEAPRADASAAIRQQDTTGDSYVAFEPGTSRKALREVDGQPTIACDAERSGDPCPHTLVAPRFDDLLNAFGPAERTGIQLTLTELATAVDRRGSDLNRAALDLKPGLMAANRALTEVDRQNAALRSFIGDAEAVTGQAASQRKSLARSIDALAGTLSVTAEETRSLDAGLQRLPATARTARTTLAALGRAATATRPLAEELLAGAPQLATAVRRAPDFLDDAKVFLRRTRPTLDKTHRLIKAGAPTIEAEPSRIVTGPFDLAPAISNLLRGVLGENETIEVLFNKNFGFGAIAREPANQLLYPPEFAERRFMRTSMILNCEGFGVPVKPGCLVDALSSARSEASARGDATAPRSERERKPRAKARRKRRSDRDSASRGDRGKTPDERSDPGSAPSAPQPEAAPSAPAAPAAPAPAPAPSVPGAPPAPPKADEVVRDLLDFLLK